MAGESRRRVMRQLNASVVLVASTWFAAACSHPSPDLSADQAPGTPSSGIAALAPPSTVAETATSPSSANAHAAPAPRGPTRVAGVSGPGGGAAGTAGSAGAGAGDASPMTVVILMLPNDGDDRGPHPDGRTYKLSLTADAQTASVEVDGRLVGTTQVQRVYPRDHERFIVRSGTDGAIAREILPARPEPQPGIAVTRARAPQPLGSPAGLSLVRPPTVLNPNGAPIID
jgi:hypothetical protein